MLFQMLDLDDFGQYGHTKEILNDEPIFHPMIGTCLDIFLEALTCFKNQFISDQLGSDESDSEGPWSCPVGNIWSGKH